MVKVKRKRYFGRKDNVEKNRFCEDFMLTVSEDQQKIKKFRPDGFMSRDQVEREFKFSKEDFNVIKDNAIIAKTRGQTGLYFPLIVVKQQNDSKKLTTVPGDWVDEQTIIRSYRKKFLPAGFPSDFRDFGRFGKQQGRGGKATHFYSKAFLLEHFNLKVLDVNEPFILANNVPFAVESEPKWLLRLTKPPTMVSSGYFGDLVYGADVVYLF